ncbi:MAG: hypothetical protein Q9160_006387 [Pyrenula sp. 1 TL-2023]
MSHSAASRTSSAGQYPAFLGPSELGTKDWDDYYTTEQQNALSESSVIGDDDLSALPTWFQDVNAPRKILDFLLSTHFPLSPNYKGNEPRESPIVLDVGTGNGRTLFQLRDGRTGESDSESDADSDVDEEFITVDESVEMSSAGVASTISEQSSQGYKGPLYGADYSASSISLAKALGARCSSYKDIHFHTMDVLADHPDSISWWPRSQDGSALKLFDLILDKGTFDAISLAQHPAPGSPTAHPSTIYPRRVGQLLRPGGFLLVTSCNWTEDEIIAWFTSHQPDTASSEREQSRINRGTSTFPVFEVFDKIDFPTFIFGGKAGAGVASVCFRRAK